MRVLLLILQFPPDVNSTGLLYAQIGEGLIERGHQVSVITTFPHYEHFRVWPEYRGRLAERENWHGMDVLRLYVHARGSKQSLPNRFLSYFSFNALATAAGLATKTPFDVILCTNGGFFSGITAALLGRVHGLPVVLNVQDLYPETPIRTGQIHNGALIRILRALERYQYSCANRIGVITPAFRAHLLASGVQPERICVIPNFVDARFIRPLPKDNEFSRRHSLADKFVVSHSGNVGYAYDLETMLSAAALLRNEPDILFLVVGDGVLRARLEDQARELALPNVRFLPFQPFESLPWLRASCDVHVSLNRPGASGHSMPSKVYEIMASGRPLLASADRGSDLWRLVEETGCGLVIDPREPETLASAVLRLYRDPDGRAQMAERGRTEAERQYSRDAVVGQYERLLAQAVAGARPAEVVAQMPNSTYATTARESRVSTGD
jgi:colanic acid biosynthesis glycosyl transferase WcaI